MTPFAESNLVTQVAMAMFSALSGQATEPTALWATLPIDERQQWVHLAAMALRQRNATAVNVAYWRAAEAIASEHFNREFKGLRPVEQAMCRTLANVAIDAYCQHLQGMTTPDQERQTLSLIGWFKSKVAEYRLRRENEQAEERRRLDAILAPRVPSEALADFAYAVTRAEAERLAMERRVVPITRRKTEGRVH